MCWGSWGSAGGYVAGPHAEWQCLGAAHVGWSWCWACAPLWGLCLRETRPAPSWGCLRVDFQGPRPKPQAFLRSSRGHGEPRGRPRGRGERHSLPSWWGATPVPISEGSLPPGSWLASVQWQGHGTMLPWGWDTGRGAHLEEGGQGQKCRQVPER